MMELLLQAENARQLGLLDQADRLYWQVLESDPANSIAVVGLGRVALERGDERTALAFGRKALEVDPENAMAGRLVDRLEEVIRERGDVVPAVHDVVLPGPKAEPSAAAQAAQAVPAPAPTPEHLSAPKPRRGLIHRLLRRP